MFHSHYLEIAISRPEDSVIKASWRLPFFGPSLPVPSLEGLHLAHPSVLWISSGAQSERRAVWLIRVWAPESDSLGMNPGYTSFWLCHLGQVTPALGFQLPLLKTEI